MCQRFFFLCFLFFSVAAEGQLLPFKKYTEKDGLNARSVHDVIEDNRGLLWVGTPFGINWFDGSRFFQPEVPKKVNQVFVQRFYKNKEGIVWTLTFYNGFYKFQNNHFTQYLIDSTYKVPNKNNIMDMTEVDSSHYVIASDAGTYLFDGKNYSPIDEKNLQGQAECVLMVKNYLLVGNGEGLFCYDSKNHWKLVSKNIDGITVNKVVYNNDHLWAATDKGLYYFDHFDFEGKNLPGKIYRDDAQVLDVVINSSNEVWFNADGNTYKLSGNQLSEYDRSTGLTAATAHIYFDQQNTGWFTTSEGLFKLSEEYYSFQKKNYGLLSFTKANDKVWMSYFGGFKDLSGKFSYAFPASVQAKFTSIFYAKESKQLWVINESGMFVLKNGSLQKKFSLQCSYLYEDADGSLWIATIDNKIFRFKDNHLQNIEGSFFSNDFVMTICKDAKGFYWLGFRSGGILKCNFENNRLTTIKEYSSKTGFTDLRIRSCQTDADGNILFGTRTNGLFVISANNDNDYWHIVNSSGLNATWITSIDREDSSVYLGTNNGLYILKSTTSYAHPQITAVNFSNEEISKEIFSVMADKDVVWVGTNGLIQFFPKKYRKDVAPSPVYITQVSVDGKPDSSWIPYSSQTQTLSLPYNKNVIAFEFVGAHLKDEDALRYRYKLEGQDKDWNVISDRNFVSYNLPPGHYRFLVEAQNASGVWSKQPASYAFIIAQPFWTTWWFIVLLIIAAFVIAYFIYHYRLQQAIKLERLRYKISTDLHDDIGSTLSSISILSEMAMTGNNRQQNEAMVAEIKENSLSLMEKMDDIVWSINPKNDSLGSLLLRIKRFSSKLFEAKDIDYSIDIDKTVSEIKLPMEYRQHIYLILKEAINNLVKYSEATKAAIEVNFTHAILKIRVSDNGKGFEMNADNFGNGIISMKARAALMKADLKIETSKCEGTTIRLAVKIK